MANEGNESSRGNNRRSNMDLNLYLGLPRSPRRARPDLGSDLALSSIPINSSSSSSVASIEDSNTPINGSTSAPVETAESHPPYSPAAPVMDANAETLMDTSSPPNSPPEYTPYFPSYESFNPSSSSPYPSLVDPLPLPLPLPPVQELDEASNPSLMIVDDPAVAYSPPYVAAPNYIPLSAAPPPDTPSEDAPPFTFYPRNNRHDAPQFELYRPEIRFRRLIETSHRLRARRFRSSSPYVYHHGSNAASPSMVATIEGEPQPAQDTTPPPLIPCSLIQSQRKDKVKMEEPKEEGSNEDSKEKSQLESPGGHFECNICLEMANEPVVTSCGHLFCWPCLYQWLHVHSDHKECPVCKGEVTESNLTPIYGRGNADPDADPSKKKKKEQVGGSEEDVKIPPRPRGNRVESFRQQFRPVSRRFGEGIASMSRLLDQQMRHQGPPPSAAAPPSSQNLEASMQDVLEGAHRRVLTRLRARRLHRQHLQQQLQHQHQHQDSSANINNNNNNDSSQPVMIASPVTIGAGLINGPATSAGAGAANPNPNSDSLFRDGIDLWHRFSLYGLASTERLAVLTADLGRVVGRFASMSTTSTNNNNNGASSSAAGQMEPSSSERGGVGGGGSQVAAALAADQVSASSTMAVIQGEAGTGIWDEPVSEHPNSSAGSSRAHQRRRVRGLGGASTSSAAPAPAPAPATAERQGNEEDSLDVDGEPTQHLRKRRRLN
ncbi:hypothetical protein LUZ60_002540 [Juncus effusus]|nr:hypothetical protein LUZ60_002540 [Juncus effusus]